MKSPPQSPQVIGPPSRTDSATWRRRPQGAAGGGAVVARGATTEVLGMAPGGQRGGQATELGRSRRRWRPRRWCRSTRCRGPGRRRGRARPRWRGSARCASSYPDCGPVSWRAAWLPLPARPRGPGECFQSTAGERGTLLDGLPASTSSVPASTKSCTQGRGRSGCSRCAYSVGCGRSRGHLPFLRPDVGGGSTAPSRARPPGSAARPRLTAGRTTTWRTGVPPRPT